MVEEVLLDLLLGSWLDDLIPWLLLPDAEEERTVMEGGRGDRQGDLLEDEDGLFNLRSGNDSLNGTFLTEEDGSLFLDDEDGDAAAVSVCFVSSVTVTLSEELGSLDKDLDSLCFLSDVNDEEADSRVGDGILETLNLDFCIV